ncbi:hypothetical protein NHX12_016961, partial [Muraenolepis orangiensis]
SLVQHKDKLKMKTQMRLLCFAVFTLLAEAEIPAQRPGNIMENFTFPLVNYRPLLENVNPENEDLSTVSVTSLTFPAQETDCSQMDPSMQGQTCPLKENGKRMQCTTTVSSTTQDGDVQGFEFSCHAEIKEASLKRVRRRIKFRKVRKFLRRARKKIIPILIEVGKRRIPKFPY